MDERLSPFQKFCGGRCTFGDITTELCEEFREYLLYAHSLRHLTKRYRYPTTLLQAIGQHSAVC